jgi:hypothetical protein
MMTMMTKWKRPGAVLRTLELDLLSIDLPYPSDHRSQIYRNHTHRRIISLSLIALRQKQMNDLIQQQQLHMMAGRAIYQR